MTRSAQKKISIPVAGPAIRTFGRVRHFLPTVNEPGTQIRLDKRNLAIDPRYQRKLNEERVRRFSAAWNWLACGVIKVSKRPGKDGHYYIIDGQHRWAAAMRIEEIRDLPCIVFELESPKEEALGFLASNTEHRNPTMRDQYAALLMAEDPVAQRLEVHAKTAKRVVGAPADKLHISCVSLVMRFIREDDEILTAVWPLIADIAKDHPMHARLVSGVYGLERRLPNGISLSQARYGDRLRQIGNDSLLREIGNYCALEGTGGEKQCAMGVLRAYNNGLRQKLRADFDGVPGYGSNY